MKNQATIHAMDVCLALVAAGLLSGCGGGNGSGAAGMADTLVASADEQPTVWANKTKPGVSADGSVSSDPTMVFTKVADENGTFRVGSRTTVRYGTADGARWVSKTVSGTGQCTNQFFGSDPARGTAKVCEAESAAVAVDSTLTVAKAPAPDTSTTPEVTTGAIYIDVTKIPPPSVGISTLNVTSTTEVAPDAEGAFRTSCALSHMSFDDPIVFPGQPGRSHLHAFFGNTGANAASTADSLRTTGNSTCRGGIANRSSYWVPAMIDTRDGSPVKPDSMQVYYKFSTMPGLSAENVQPLPAGLRMIAGNPAATGPRTDADPFAYRWKCIGGPNNSNDQYGSQIPSCDLGAQVFQEIFFPACWDGKNLDSPDHKSHMSGPVQLQTSPFTWSCPATHPVLLPQISFNVLYTVTDKAARWRLASDLYDPALPAGYSSHADWFNGWRSDISDTWAKSCIQARKDCHSHLLGDGRMIF